jgi:hypothetical protein
VEKEGVYKSICEDKSNMSSAAAVVAISARYNNFTQRSNIQPGFAKQ